MNTHLLAQIRNPVLPAQIGAGGYTQGGSVVGRFISSSVSFLLLAALILSFFYLVLGGIQWITSHGEKTGLEKARNKIEQAVAGVLVVAASWAVFTLIGNFIGLDVTNLPIPTITP